MQKFVKYEVSEINDTVQELKEVIQNQHKLI